MKVKVKAIIIKNEWRLNEKYRGPLGWIRRWRKGKLEKAHGVKLLFGETEAIIDLSHMIPQMPNFAYAFIPPLPVDSNDGLIIDMIPPDADLYPYEIDIIAAPEEEDKTPGVV